MNPIEEKVFEAFSSQMSNFLTKDLWANYKGPVVMNFLWNELPYNGEVHGFNRYISTNEDIPRQGCNTVMIVLPNGKEPQNNEVITLEDVQFSILEQTSSHPIPFSSPSIVDWASSIDFHIQKMAWVWSVVGKEAKTVFLVGEINGDYRRVVVVFRRCFPDYSFFY
jgi:hypothetical protein